MSKKYTFKMINKKNSFVLVIILIVIIQFLLLIKNTQKSSFRYFIWNIQDVSIGRLIFISFVSGMFVSSLLNKTVSNHNSNKFLFEGNDKSNDDNNYPVEREDNEEQPYDFAPERDLRDPQPTISVNYRVVKNNGENEFKEKKQAINNSQYDEDWNNKFSEW